MIRSNTAIDPMCKDCRVKPREEGPRCKECHRKWKRATMKRVRHKKRLEMLKQNPELVKEGKRICGKCFKIRQLTEFGTTQSRNEGKMNKLCDRCLSQMYGYKGEGLDYKYWRRRAYTVNTAARIRLAQRRNVKTKEIKFTDLSFECKPLDLQEMYDKDPLCHYCRTELTSDNLSLDHKQPTSRDGDHSMDNLVMCCRDCNQLKLDRTYDEFLAFQEVYFTRLSKVLEQRD